MAGQQGSDIEFRFAVKALAACGGIPAKKTIDPNDFGLRKLGLIDYNGSIEVHSSLLNVVLHEEPHINT
jgi:hypothetical protein